MKLFCYFHGENYKRACLVFTFERTVIVELVPKLSQTKRKPGFMKVMAVSISVCVQGLDVYFLEKKVSWFVCSSFTLIVCSVTSEGLDLDRSS